MLTALRRAAIAVSAVVALLPITAPAATAGEPAAMIRAAAVAPACPELAPATPIPGTPVRILAVGDSITAACQWQQELDRLLTKAWVPHVITTYAVGGTSCRYWTDKITDVVAAAQPDLAYLYCGTNDNPNDSCYGESCTAWAYRSLVEAIHNYRPAKAWVVPTLIGYSDGTMSPDWLWITNEPRANDTIYSQFLYYTPPATQSWFAGIADVQKMPGTGDYLDGDTCNPATTTCAVHPNAKGYRTIGRIMYDSVAPNLGWPAATALGEPVLCGMYGHRKGGTRPQYTPCN